MKKHPGSGNVMHIESRSVAARAQLIDALSVFGAVGQFLMRIDSEDFNQHHGALDGTVKDAAEATMIRACARLDDILADNSRWSMQERDNLEKTISKSYEESTKMFAKQAELSAEANTPHFKMNPFVVRLAPGVWLAFKGDPNNIQASLCGIGSSPAAAQQCFDDAFNGKLTPEQIEYIKKTLYEATVDRRGNQQIAGPPGEANTPPADSAGAESDSKVGGSKDSESKLILPGDEGFNDPDKPAYGPDDDPGAGLGFGH